MVKDDASARRQAHVANFTDVIFKKSFTSERDLEEFRQRHIVEGYSARLLARTERLNSYIKGRLILSPCHFEVGLRLPFWPEYLQILQYFDIVPTQINSNDVAIIMGFLCYLREERIVFDLSVLQEIFAFAATLDGIVFFSSHVCTLVGTVNKVHRWSEYLVVVTGDFDGVLGRPHQPADVAFLVPILKGKREKLVEAFCGRQFVVIHWGINVNVLLEIHPCESKSSEFEHTRQYLTLSYY
ncbi:hypothetical protein KSP40_PGU003608 [Platanthera guangdongensis]|uniref:Uncharacterized protein n=1 Tax=Platanthera guangdongensis TaxID=2320717 RepID=A0ABR2MVD7_9ASPA